MTINIWNSQRKQRKVVKVIKELIDGTISNVYTDIKMICLSDDNWALYVAKLEDKYDTYRYIDENTALVIVEKKF